MSYQRHCANTIKQREGEKTARIVGNGEKEPYEGSISGMSDMRMEEIGEHLRRSTALMCVSSAPLDVRCERMPLYFERSRRAAAIRASRRRVGRALTLMETVEREERNTRRGMKRNKR